MNPADAAFEAALIAWLARQAAAEERLTSFAFREDLPSVDVPSPSSHAALRAWILATVADPLVAAFLERVADEGRPMADLARDGEFGLEPGDRVALAARVGVLAAGGLVARDLEGDRVTLTELGRSALALAAPTAVRSVAELSPSPTLAPSR
jgi:hypothetical protein